MKLAIYIEGTIQIILTPENEWEKMALEPLGKSYGAASIVRGSFYNCQGGWARQGSEDDSIILLPQPYQPTKTP